MKKIILCAALTFVTLSGLAVVKINQASSDVKITERPVGTLKISRAASRHIKKAPDRAFFCALSGVHL
ncbi:PhrK family phosphatase-inhibitory pheromone [Bacillus velezensis]|uniref:PhrK family phosphatase-inhibitory pheromone n=1 Tax=Bacillus velezensis TaxID=492670 RepID=UPI002E1FF4BD|nr:PhrK family phosphatase-inhibitory pheromone [Bacillus velezensis]